MGEAEWTFFNDSLDINQVDRGVTSGIARPPGGGSFLYAFNSLLATAGAVAKFCNLTNFAPMAKGGSISAAIQRGVGGGDTEFSPFLILLAQGNSVNDSAYKFGLSDEDPHRIVLRKGSIVSGCAEVAQSTGLLAQSSETFSPGTWLHLRLDATVNLNGDTILDCWQNDLDMNDVDSPVWEAIPGMSQVIDDHLGIVTGSQPYTSGRAGFGFRVDDVTRRSYFDHIVLIRQV